MDPISEPVLFYTPGACSLACMVAMEWLGQPYRLCRVEKDVRAGDAFRRINPRAQVPALRVDRRTLVETNAILTHLADRDAGGAMLPASGRWERDLANQWLAYLGSGFHPPFWPYFLPQRYTRDAAGYQAVRDAAVEAIRREMGLVNTHLEGKDVILGDQPTVLDAYLHAMDRWANKIVDVPAEFPHVWRHQKMMSRNPAVRLAVAIERGEVAAAASTAFQGHVDLTDL